MIKKVFISFILFVITLQTIVIEPSHAITAEERLEEVEKQLIAIANQIKQYEGDKTDLEKNILANDTALKKVNDELAEVQRKLAIAEAALEKALEGYDQSLNNLASVQENIVREQVTLGKTKNEIAKVKDELFETQKSLNSAKDELQIKAVDMYIDGVMSPATAIFISLNDLSDFLAALGYASAIVNTAYEIIESLNSFESLSETQTKFLSEREEQREEIISSLQIEEERKNQISKLDAEHANLEKLEDAIQADINRLSSLGGVAPNKLTWPITGSYVSSGYKWRRFRGVTSFHGAIDIPGRTGTPIKAAAGGVVILARYYGLAGRTVFIDHGGGMTTLYFHMNEIRTSVGQTVVTGDVIGTVGSTGRSSGPHLHFEVRLKNPNSVSCSLPYLDPTSRGRMNPYCFLD